MLTAARRRFGNSGRNSSPYRSSRFVAGRRTSPSALPATHAQPRHGLASSVDPSLCFAPARAPARKSRSSTGAVFWPGPQLPTPPSAATQCHRTPAQPPAGRAIETPGVRFVVAVTAYEV